MAMAKWKRIGLMILVPLVLVGLGASVLGARYWWYHGYSTGSRTGTIRKVSLKGSPVCRYWSIELVTIANAGTPGDVWEFSVDDARPDNPLIKKLHEAERSAKPVTVDYRQDLGNKGKLWVCSPSEYYATNVE